MDSESGEGRLRRLSKDNKKSRRRAGLGIPLMLALVFVMLLVGGLVGYRALFAGASASDGPVTVTVEQGESLSSVAHKLQESGAIGSAKFFELRARIEGLGTEIKPGEYQIRPGESGREILSAMIEGGKETTSEVAIPEGFTLAQTATRVSGQSSVSAAEFRRAARRVDYGYDFLDGGAVRSTEGLLFPKQYEFKEKTRAPQMVDRMLEQYALETEGLDFQRAQHELGMSEYQIVTVASLVEREAAGAEEKPVIASVIYNRLRADMPLQIDATVRYALGKPKESLSLKDLEVESPYNTYKHQGLPPGPIASPGQDSIRAALNPADTDYLYYVLDRDGKEHTFTESYNEFLKAKGKAGK